MVFLHGTPGSRRLAELFESTARDTDVRILAPDRPGYGRSDPWSDRSIRDGGRVVRTVLDHAGIDTASRRVLGRRPVRVRGRGGAAESDRSTGRGRRRDPPEYARERPTTQRVLNWIGSTAPSVLAALFRAQRWVAQRRDPSFVVAQYTTGDPTDAVSDHAAEIVRRTSSKRLPATAAAQSPSSDRSRPIGTSTSKRSTRRFGSGTAATTRTSPDRCRSTVRGGATDRPASGARRCRPSPDAASLRPRDSERLLVTCATEDGDRNRHLNRRRPKSAARE